LDDPNRHGDAILKDVLRSLDREALKAWKKSPAHVVQTFRSA